MQVRLNMFQKSMLDWNAAHAYNAIHVVRIGGALDLRRLRHAINATVERWGLASVALNLRQGTIEYESGPADCQIHLLDSVDGPPDTLVTEMERRLNLPFAVAGRFQPFRWLVAPGKDSFFVGLVYFHPVADAESVVWLLRDLTNHYLDTEGNETRREKGISQSPNPPITRREGSASVRQAVCSTGDGGVPDVYPDSRTHLWRRHPMIAARKLLALAGQIRDLRQSCRVGRHDVDAMDNGFTLLTLDAARLRLLVMTGKAWDVTVNDLFLALLLKALAPLAAARTGKRRRRKISVGCIVNLRRQLDLHDRRTFGLFLGSFIVTQAVPEGITLRELAGGVRRQTRYIKRHRLFLGSALELGIGRLLLKCYSPERRKRFYAKNYPLWGGLTNMNLNSIWEAGDRNAPLDYFRGVSTGPVTPLVLSVTTFGDRANIGLSYRTAIFSRPEIEDLKGRLLDLLVETRGTT